MNHKHHEMKEMESMDGHHHDQPVEDTEIQDWKKKLFWSWVFTIPIAFLMLSERIFGFSLIEVPYSIIVILILGFPVVFIFGWDTIKGGTRGLFTFYFNMDSLIALGTVIAYLTGIFAFTGIVLDYSGVAAMIMAFYTTGKYVEAVARGRASQEIKKLLELGAKYATIKQDGILYVKATKVGKDTFLAHIIKLVEETQSEKIPIQKLADKITSIFVPTILVIAILTFVGWWYIVGDLSRSLGVGIAVLVIACPCALGLATPTALMVGSGMGAKRGILIRKGEAIQTMKEIKIVVFDKTGTITKGKPEVREIYSKIKENYMMEIAASLEKLSEHPLSQAIVNKANLN